MEPTYVDRPGALKRIVDRCLKARIVRGTVRAIRSESVRLTLDVDGESVSMISCLQSPEIALGDHVVLWVGSKTSSVASNYYNETTGANDLDSLREGYRRFALWGGGFSAIAFAIFGTVAIAASREKLSLPVSVLIHTPLYLLAIVGGFIMSIIAFLLLVVALVMQRTHENMRRAISSNPRSALARARPPESLD
jgi:hypothetical protein